MSLIFPPPLRPGAKIAIVSPASAVSPSYVHGAAERIEAAGFRALIMPHALGPACGSYAAGLDERLADLQNAWADPEVGAILCARGGYGCVHLLSSISDSFLRYTPKWLIGFSDVSALHARLAAAGIASVHGSMAKYIDADPDVLLSLLNIICSPSPSVDYRYPSSPLNGLRATVSAPLLGGNLAVLSHLIGTPYDIFAHTGCILFIEDISEAIYALERMLWQLWLSGAFSHCRAVIVGRFTETSPDRNYPDPYAMIHARLSQWGVLAKIPVVFDIPVGHIPGNIPLIHGARVTLSDNGSYVTLSSFAPC